eukprot:gnl/MRDRNA2_/MRDRNA2_122782_c0_seq1.p1 gnl/MRDRNA2_/MRDRNA2_122782_c0~~gnl/MRDRNA2_/MRDRNA2_122782_c0_seq1.p1  ORF type:complete len:141 (-),score=26.75 gnl/MRDRNA2_/MRDRNA2_122782_c0_seq1:148-570(-)
MVKIFAAAVVLAGALKVAANTNHYGDPKDGCEADEQKMSLRGLSGAFCSPPCKSNECPTDVPSGVTATPTCALVLHPPMYEQYCALVCSPSNLRSNGANGECGTGSCQPVHGKGICTYPSSDAGLAATLVMPAEKAQLII